MPENDQTKRPIGETERSFESSQAEGYQTDLFSRGDEEGIPAEPSPNPDEVADDPRVLEAGEADGYQTDAFSRGDEEGVPQGDLQARQPKPAGASGLPESTQRKAVDDADSRDAPPMTGPEGGVR